MGYLPRLGYLRFYSHVNYSVTKIVKSKGKEQNKFYSHVNYSVTKIGVVGIAIGVGFTVT